MLGVEIQAHMVSQIVSAVRAQRAVLWWLPQRGGFQWGDFLVVWICSLLAQEGAWDFTKYGRPGNRDGGASRGDCPAVQTHITALMPTSNWGKTVAPRPTFWFYVPYSPQD